MGLVVTDRLTGVALSWIRFSGDVPGAKWGVSQIDPEAKRSVLIFKGARVAASFEPVTMGAGRCGDAKLAGSAFLFEGKIAISGLVHPEEAALFNAEDGSSVRHHSALTTYFSSWSIEVPDGAMWRTIFSRSREA